MDMLMLMHDANPRGFLVSCQADNVPMDARELARLTMGETAEVEILLQELQQRRVCSMTEDGIVYNRRMADREDLSAIRRDAGRKGAEARWHEHKQKQSKPDGKHSKSDGKREWQNVVSGNGNGNGSGNGSESKQPKSNPEDFDRFWTAYPRKAGKGAARKAWLKLKPAPELVETILAAVDAQRQGDAWKDPKYIPHPATWLNAERWLDEAPPLQKSGSLELIDYDNCER